MTKTCFKCNRQLPPDMFYRHSQMADGHLGKCKDCTRKDSKARYNTKIVDKTFVWAERARGREKAKRLGYGPGTSEYTPRNAKERAQSKARAKVRNLPALSTGKNYHHWSYNPTDATDVFVFADATHRRIHRYMVYDAERLQFRRLDGVLLDTRESAQRYYDYVLSLADGEYPSNPPN